jgi:NAD(P)-dependent dehydrogenase (short-subunit alcohol dehydrogenase family)
MGAGAVAGPSDLQPIGNGRAAAMAYAGEGATVIAVDIDAIMAQETKQMIENNGGSCSVIQADVSSAKDCQAVAEQSLKAHGRIDILHNNVGVGAKKPGGILDADEEDWDRVMNVNVKSIFHSCRAVVPQMIQQGNGAIINISSVGAVLHAYPALFIYTISKAAVNTFTRCLAYELADKGVRVNCIMPGMIDSPVIYKEILPLYDGDMEKMRKDRSARVPMKQMGDPRDIAQASLFLASDKAKYITGQVLSVDGGLLLAGG